MTLPPWSLRQSTEGMRLPLWPAFRVGAARSEYPILPALAPAPAENPAVISRVSARPHSSQAASPACTRRAAWSWGGRGLPRSFALRRMPRQALLVK